MITSHLNNGNGYAAELSQVAEEEYQRCLKIMKRSQRSQPPIFGFSTALKLLMIELPRNYSLSDDVVHICVSDPMQRSAMKNTQYHLSSVPMQIIAIGEGDSMICTVDAVTACLQMAGFCSREETTVLFDFITRRGNLKREEFERNLEEQIAHSGKFKGKKNAVWAFNHHRANTDSSMETRLRLALVERKLGNPIVNPVLRDLGGDKYWYLDLVIVDVGMVLEYQGKAWHSSQTSLTNDSEKSLAMQKYGLLPIAVVAPFVQDPYKREEFLESLRMLRRKRQRTLSSRQKSIFVELFPNPGVLCT